MEQRTKTVRGIGRSFVVLSASGTATFDDIEIDAAASNYKLTATGTGGVTSATSGFFGINPDVADHLIFSVQPSNAAVKCG